MPGSDRVIMNLRAFADDRLRAAIGALAEREALEMEAEAKGEAPWEDRTANARNGLWGAVEETPSELRIAIGHQVEYGIYLELRQGPGRREILQPVRDRHAKPFFEVVQELVRP